MSFVILTTDLLETQCKISKFISAMKKDGIALGVSKKEKTGDRYKNMKIGTTMLMRSIVINAARNHTIPLNMKKTLRL